MKPDKYLVDRTSGLPPELVAKARELEDEWVKANGAKRVAARGVPGKRAALLGKQHRFAHIPGEDHGEMWMCDRGDGPKPKLVFHPYPMTDFDLVPLIAFCQQRRLSIVIDARSFYVPGRTLLVEIARP